MSGSGATPDAGTIVPSVRALAGRVCLPTLPMDWRAVGDVAGTVALSGMPGADVLDGGHRVRGDAQAAAHVVPGMWFSPVRRTASAPWVCNGCSGSAATRRPRGPGSTSCGEQWSGPVGIASPALSRLTKPMSAAPNEGKAGPGSRPTKASSSRWRPRRGVAASAGSAFGASRTCPRTAFFPSSRMPCRPGRWSIPTDGVVIAGWRRPATSTKSLSSATARNRPMRSSSPHRCFASQAVAARHPPGRHSAPASRLLPRRIHLPVQSTALTSPGAALPQTRPTGCRCRTDSLPHHHRSCRFRSPDSGTGVKGIPSKYILEEAHISFDHLVVFLDISDIEDEAKIYWIDDDDRVNITERESERWHETRRKNQPLKQPSDLPAEIRIKKFLKDNSILIRFVVLIKDTLKTKLAKKKNSVMENELGTGKARALWTVDDRLFASYGAKGLRRASENMDRLLDVVRKYGIDLTVVVYPWPDQIINRDLNSRQVSFWQAWAKGRNVEFVNLFPAFISDKDGEATIREYFFPGDVHWNEFGHRLVAERFLRYYEKRAHQGN